MSLVLWRKSPEITKGLHLHLQPQERKMNMQGKSTFFLWPETYTIWGAFFQKNNTKVQMQNEVLEGDFASERICSLSFINFLENSSLLRPEVTKEKWVEVRITQTWGPETHLSLMM